MRWPRRSGKIVTLHTSFPFSTLSPFLSAQEGFGSTPSSTPSIEIRIHTEFYVIKSAQAQLRRHPGKSAQVELRRHPGKSAQVELRRQPRGAIVNHRQGLINSLSSSGPYPHNVSLSVIPDVKRSVLLLTY